MQLEHATQMVHECSRVTSCLHRLLTYRVECIFAILPLQSWKPAVLLVDVVNYTCMVFLASQLDHTYISAKAQGRWSHDSYIT